MGFDAGAVDDGGSLPGIRVHAASPARDVRSFGWIQYRDVHLDGSDDVATGVDLPRRDSQGADDDGTGPTENCVPMGKDGPDRGIRLPGPRRSTELASRSLRRNP